MSDQIHAHHADVAKRLKGAQGHLQLHAAEEAIGQAKRTFIQDHLDHCLEATVGAVGRDRRGPIEEFKEITKHL